MLAPSRTVLIVLAILLITPAALGVHELMLEGLHVPHPNRAGVPAAVGSANLGLSVFALMAFFRLARPSLVNLNWVQRGLIGFVVFSMLRETLRLVIIDSILSNGWAFHLISAAPTVSYDLLLAAAAAAAVRWSKSNWALVALSGVIAISGQLLVKPLINSAFAPVLASLSFLDFPQIYQEPFHGLVLFIIYATFVEAVIATLLLAALTWKSLCGRASIRLLQFTLQVLLMKGSLLPLALYIFWEPPNLMRAALSESQFTLETTVMALLSGIAWTLIDSRPRKTSLKGP